jgi:hypothetical protein
MSSVLTRSEKKTRHKQRVPITLVDDFVVRQYSKRTLSLWRTTKSSTSVKGTKQRDTNLLNRS